MSELVWHKHSGDRMPVPGDCLVKIRQEGVFALEAAIFQPADAWRWCGSVTEFAIDPDQPPQLGGPLEVGASYIRRDGEIITLMKGYTFTFCDQKGMWGYEENGFCGGRENCQPTKDLICRYYPPSRPPECREPTTGDDHFDMQRFLTQKSIVHPLTVGRKPETREQYEARRLAKCEEIARRAAMKGPPAVSKAERAPGSELGDITYARLGWQK
jgi:hypothetical protein